jgi:hypothetical protein
MKASKSEMILAWLNYLIFQRCYPALMEEEAVTAVVDKRGDVRIHDDTNREQDYGKWSCTVEM